MELAQTTCLTLQRRITELIKLGINFMPFHGPGPGRPKGSVNRNPAEIKEMILKALEHKGGWRYLAKQADANPVAFLGLLGKIMPLQVNGAGNVLLIEQLCVVANNEWQKERQKLNAPTIEAEAESVEIKGNDASQRGSGRG